MYQKQLSGEKKTLETIRILRVIDVNFNRCKEGLRVIEDVFRFMFENDSLRKELRYIRHALDEVANEKIIKCAIANREANSDIGRKVDCLESNRKNISDIIYVNTQRIKESLRVIEEFFKIILPSQVALIKKLRYKIYVLEKKIIIGYIFKSSSTILQKRKLYL